MPVASERHVHNKRNCRAFVSRHIKAHVKEGMPQRQAVAAALSEARRLGCKISKQ
ncbi:MAG: hypothetical protein HYS81_03970 [Candidatus Aenigmatarchaeota archaeon]|nr:MAG: hypothetical protein HYS81_03970 [Candidatus Aenigmarchaeota archaeon]